MKLVRYITKHFVHMNKNFDILTTLYFFTMYNYVILLLIVIKKEKENKEYKKKYFICFMYPIFDFYNHLIYIFTFLSIDKILPILSR